MPIFEYLSKKNFKKDFYVILEIAVFVVCLSIFFLDRCYHFIAPYLFAILIPVLAVNRGWFSRLLSLEALLSMRPLSYGIYLIHPFYIYLYRKTGIPFNIANSFFYIFLVLISAIILYKFIEKPGIRLGYKF